MVPSSGHSRKDRYTVDQVLRGIQAFVAEYCDSKLIIDPESSVYAYHDAAVASHDCSLIFLEELAEYFDLNWGESRWGIWLKIRGNRHWSQRQREAAWRLWERDIAPQLTVRKLAEYIARHAPAPSFEPVVVLGRQCAPAGVFLGLCDLAKAGPREIAPSTPLRHLRSAAKIQDLWKRSEWICGVALPTVTPARLSRFKLLADWALAAAVAVALLCAACTWVQLAPILGVAFATFASLVAGAVALVFGHTLVDRYHNPLPPHIQTFGDLAKLLDVRRHAPAA